MAAEGGHTEDPGGEKPAEAIQGHYSDELLGERLSSRRSARRQSPGWPAGPLFAAMGLRLLAAVVAKDQPREAEALLRRDLANLDDWPGRSAYERMKLRGERERVQFGLFQVRSQLDEHHEAATRLHDLARQELEDPQICNDVAWVLATAEDPRYRDPSRAVELARIATEKSPENAGHWNTLGVAHYRARDWSAAVTALEKSCERNSGGDATDFFFLAMAHCQLGDHDAARAWFDRGVAGIGKGAPKGDELERFREEAAARLRSGGVDPMMPNGAAAFAR